jgi:hypothetical protein
VSDIAAPSLDVLSSVGADIADNGSNNPITIEDTSMALSVF